MFQRLVVSSGFCCCKNIWSPSSLKLQFMLTYADDCRLVPLVGSFNLGTAVEDFAHLSTWAKAINLRLNPPKIHGDRVRWFHPDSTLRYDISMTRNLDVVIRSHRLPNCLQVVATMPHLPNVCISAWRGYVNRTAAWKYGNNHFPCAISGSDFRLFSTINSDPCHVFKVLFQHHYKAIPILILDYTTSLCHQRWPELYPTGSI